MFKKAEGQEREIERVASALRKTEPNSPRFFAEESAYGWYRDYLSLCGYKMMVKAPKGMRRLAVRIEKKQSVAAEDEDEKKRGGYC